MLPILRNRYYFGSEFGGQKGAAELDPMLTKLAMAFVRYCFYHLLKKSSFEKVVTAERPLLLGMGLNEREAGDRCGHDVENTTLQFNRPLRWTAYVAAKTRETRIK